MRAVPVAGDDIHQEVTPWQGGGTPPRARCLGPREEEAHSRSCRSSGSAVGDAARG